MNICVDLPTANDDECSTGCTEIDVESLVTAEGANTRPIVCRRCESPIFPPGKANIQTGPSVDLKLMSPHGAGELDCESVDMWWHTGDDGAFDTIGWQTVDGKKSLMCGDCEFGPVGWRTDDNKEFFVAAGRVMYK